MPHIFNEDFKDFLRSLNQNQVMYILVGGYAVILHGYERVTGDMDIWVKPSEENYSKMQSAFKSFGMPMFDMTLDNFLNIDKFDVFRFGRKPVAIDIMTKVKGLNFVDAFEESEIVLVDDIPVRLLQLHHLIEAKKQAGRNKDLNDLENLSG
ncbi:MAG TPA: hypothetical protein VM368_09200 [Flavisolibacter sp.]|nr:hypothetical protein [Flavisolibacter sp.]